MTIPPEFLMHWGRLIASDSLVHHASTRYRALDWSTMFQLPLAFDWADAGFSRSKLAYLVKKYPLNALPADGCIESVRSTASGVGLVTYRRVDLTKGWMADVLYLQHLGVTGPVVFRCPGDMATIHAVRLSCVFPVIVREGFYTGVRPNLRKTLRRAIVHRLERRYDGYGQAARANAWAHRLATPEEMSTAIRLLEAE